MKKQRSLILLAVGAVLALTGCTRQMNPTAADSPATAIPPAATETAAPLATAAPTAVDYGVPGYLNTTLEIIRNGKAYSLPLGMDIGNAFFMATPQPELDPTIDIPTRSSASLEWYGDLDTDGETEYLAVVTNVGASASMSVLAVDYDSAQDEYRVFDEISFRASTFDHIEDIHQDGNPEVLARNEEFHYACGGGGADAVFSPLLILRYNGTEWVNVTAEFPQLVEADAQHWLESIASNADGQGQFDTIYAAYLADMVTLGKEEEGTAVFMEQCGARLLPAYQANDAATAFTCEELLSRVQNALTQSGYR